MMTDTTGRLFPDLQRLSKHRTSGPTDDALRDAMHRIRMARGKRVYADTVIFAALNLVDREALAAEVERIESTRYPVTAPPHEPGDPGA